MTKVALALCATVVWTAHLDADEPLTGPTLGTRTPNIADKHPDLHQILTGGTFDSMSFEQRIMFLHEPYFRDLAEYGLDAGAVDAERQFIAEMARKLADAAETSAPVFQDDDAFEKKIIEMHAAMFVANDRTIAFSDRVASAEEAIRERHQVMDVQQRMLDMHLRTTEWAQSARARLDDAPSNEALAMSEDEAHIQERFSFHGRTTVQTSERLARSVVRRLVGYGGGLSVFAPEDRLVLQSIDDLDPETIERQAVDPILRQLCALPAKDLRDRARLMNEASQAGQVALDAATTVLLDRLTADGSKRFEALVQSHTEHGSSMEFDWEGIAIDLPQIVDGILKNTCNNFDLLVGIEEVLAKGEVASP
ncbi:MAG: hypothetical protein OXQ90_07420 [Gammaproteobacteria bacterium]|nr:hypothetical protein [Gammaproteobacteria bacterium]